MPGKLVHFELPSQDTARAKAFWGGVFGWSFRDPGIPGVEYWLTQTGEDQGGAIFPTDGAVRGPIVYFDTDDINASIEKVRELGGTAEDRSPIPHVGWSANCSDTEGNDFRLFQSDESVAG
jgi:predicted enzyme related to lactoylglutathione lyase